jgi:outer membrane protein OmpA-like peptidoglycan-associated protein
VFSSFDGTDANPITKLGKRKLIKGEAATLDGDGLFGFDSGKLTAKGRAQVKAVVKNLKGSKTVHCEGYTDYAGDRSHEFDLSRRRAKAVCAALKKYGAKVTTMTRGYGPKRPAVVGGTAKSRKENRRVVILITK